MRTCKECSGTGEDTVHNAVAESFRDVDDDVRKKVIMSLMKMHPGWGQEQGGFILGF